MIKYLLYLIRHKWFVMLAGWRTSKRLYLLHDMSKFLPSEFVAYYQEFYWTQKQRDKETNMAFGLFGCCEAAPLGFFVGDRFQVAWNHHQKRNKHHWQYWMLTNDDGSRIILPMPEQYAREMVADWLGAGRAITGTWEGRKWYLCNYHKMQLEYSTRMLVNSLLKVTESDIPQSFMGRGDLMKDLLALSIKGRLINE